MPFLRVLRAVADLPSALLDLVLPQRCAGCGELGTGLCGACRRVLSAPGLGVVGRCPAPVVAAAAYDGVVRALVLAHKERGRLALTGPLGAALAAALAELPLPPGTVLVPVPSSAAVVRRRGHDHARRLAAAAGARSGLPVLPLLRQSRRVADSAGLGAAARQVNLAGALVARRPVPGLPVVLVDDVTTSGATVQEAARALSAAGADVQGAVVVAATPGRGTNVLGGRTALGSSAHGV